MLNIKFFDDLAGQVVESLNQYTKYGWHQLLEVAKEFVVMASSDDGEDQVYTLSKDLMGLIGEEVTGDFFEPGIDG